MRTILAIAVAAFAVGCSAPAPTTATPGPAKPAAVALPDSLKNDAWSYYGLGNDKPVDMQIEVEGQPGLFTGSQTTKLVGVRDGKAEYAATRTGGLADQLGASEELSLESTGVYTTKSDIATVNKDLQLPAQIKPGVSWKDHIAVQTRGQEMKLDTVNKVVGQERVTTKAGPFDAMLVTTQGAGEVSGQKIRITTKTWYVKGIGVARMQMDTIAGGGPPKRVTLQLTK